MVAESPEHSGDDVDENGLKRRMLGAAVLIALAVIFLPLVFDGSGTESQFRSIEALQMEPPFDAVILEEKMMSLPDGTPVIEFVEDGRLTVSETQEVARQTPLVEKVITTRPVAAVAEPIAVKKQLPKKVIAQETTVIPAAAVPSTTSSTPAERPDPVVDNGNWLIQIASFRDKINALGLRSDLKKEGHPVVVNVGEIAGDTIFRVFVGPIKGKRNANQVQSTIESSLNRQTLLVKEK